MNNNTVYEWVLHSIFTVNAREKSLESSKPYLCLWFKLHIMAFTIILTWPNNTTKGSLLVVAICHAVSNIVGIFVPMASMVSSENMDSYIICVLLEILAAVIITTLAGPTQRSQTGPKQLQE